MLYAVIYAINRCIFFAVAYLDIAIRNFRKTVHLYFNNCLNQVLPFNKLTDYHLKALMLGKVLTFLKLLSTNDDLLFPDKEYRNVAETKLIGPGDFYQIQQQQFK